jgi:ribosomal protein S4E
VWCFCHASKIENVIEEGKLLSASVVIGYYISTKQEVTMKAKATVKLKDGDQCKVTGGTHAGKSGTVRDMHTSKTGHVTITVVQKNGERFKTLGKNVVVESGSNE